MSRTSVGILVLAFACASVTTGCESALTDTSTASQAIEPSSCEPSEGYDTCEEIDVEQVVTWQSTVEDGTADSWRTIETSENEHADHVVDIDLTALNGGVIPTAEGQGIYESEDQFTTVLKEQLLGVSETDDVLLTIHGGPTLKLANDKTEISEASTGGFLHDALTDEDGNIFIGGELRNDVINAPELETEIFNEGTSTSSIQTKQSALSQWLSHGPWEAKQRAIGWNTTFVGVFGGAMKGFKKNGKKCRATWKFWKIFRECYKASSVSIENTFYDGNGVKVFKGSRRGQSNTKKFLAVYTDWHYGPSGRGGVRQACTDGTAQFDTGHVVIGGLCSKVTNH